MRTTIPRLPMILAPLAFTFASVACGGEQPAPQPPPPAPPAPVETASAAPPPAEPTPPPPPKPALADLMRDAAKNVREAFNAHDAAKMAAYVTDDIADYDYGGGETHGKPDFQSSIGQLFQWFPDAKTETNRVWIKGNVSIVELTWNATMTSDVMGLKATNKPVGQLRLHVSWYNDDGLVKESHEYADAAGFYAQLQGKKTAPPVPMLPSNPPEVHVAAGTPADDKLALWIKAGDDAFSKDDAKAAIANTTEDADYWINFGGPAMKGKKELVAGLTGWFKAFPDQKWTVVNAWGIDGFAIVEHTMSGTQKGALGPLPASGKPVKDWHWVDIQQPSADGKMQHGWGYANLLEMMKQTGALKPPSAQKPAPKKP